MFRLALEGPQRISQRDVVRQGVPELGSSDQEGSTTWLTGILLCINCDRYSVHIDSDV